MGIKVALPAQLKMPPGAILRFWVIYDHPPDADHAYVLRAQYTYGGFVETDMATAWYADDPEKLRGILPFGATLIGRDPKDDPIILEVWIE